MHLILTGATGLVGSGVLNHMLSLPAEQLSRLSILSRKPVPMAEGHSNVNVILHQDFTSYPPELLEKLKGAEGCVWALGVSATAVSKEEYVKITTDYPLAAASAFATLSSPFKFVYVSGEGATTSPGLLTPYFGHIKGQCEAALLSLMSKYPSLRPYSLRPAMVDSFGDPKVAEVAGGRRKGILKVVEYTLKPAIRTVWSSGVSPTQDLGRVLTDLAMGDGERLEGSGMSGDGRTLSNKAMRRIAGLDKC
ncbi:MAG: hypothetical protein M1834_001190 [Cirrosporium novae-zelandiae]|nr:MAG: hypothetical protein M1834_001190 [Cirrosporium novae-zelandiae]